MSEGLIRACAKHIQEGFRPFVSADLANEVHNFYAIYHIAAAQLLIVRANMMALHPGQFPTGAAENAAKTVENWWVAEQGLIKPHFPNTMAYDTQTHWLWLTRVVPHGSVVFREGLQREGWHVTGYATIPECGAVEVEFKKSGHTGTTAIEYMRKHLIIDLPSPDKIVCYDTHDQLFEFSLVTYHYAYAGEIQSYAPSIAARPNNGLVTIDHFTY